MSDPTGIEDSLASAFNTSFGMPPAAPREAAADDASASAAEPTSSEAEAMDAAPAVEDWRPTYEANLASWRAEADIARDKAAATRAAIEAEAAAVKKAEEDEAKGKTADEKAAKAAAERAERLAAALAEGPSPALVPAHKRAAAEERATKVREAWEHVKTADAPSAPASTTWEELSAPHSSIEDISASTQLSGTASGTTSSPASSDKRPSKPVKHTESEADEVEHDLTVPAGITPVTHIKAPVAPADETPSLTLSLFTAPKHLTLGRVVAALGINLILPFINGIMLGLGEITAREGVRLGRLWWRGERAIAGVWRKDEGRGARFVADVGLSGSHGF